MKLITNELLQLLNDIDAKIYENQNISKLVRKLHPNYPTDIIGLICDQQELRKKALKKFTLASQMLFTRKGLEQSTSEMLAQYTANLFENKNHILEVCSGIGGNTIGLVNNFQNITTNDSDPLINELHTHNLNLYAPDNHINRLEAPFEMSMLNNKNSLLIDPDRRSNGKRNIDIADYQPDISSLIENLPKNLEVIIKLSPMLNKDNTPHNLHCMYLAESMELKQALWINTNKNNLLPTFAIYYNQQFFTNTELENIKKKSISKKQFLELNPAVTKSLEYQNIADVLSLEFIPESTKYLTGYATNAEPFAKSYEILSEEPYHDKTIKKILTPFSDHRFEIKAVGLSEDEIKRLQSTFSNSSAKLLTVFIFKQKSFKQVFICQNNQLPTQA